MTRRTPYSIEISASAWSQLGTLPRAAFLRVQRELQEAARRIPHESIPGAAGANTVVSGEAGFTFDTNEYAARYEVDRTKQCIVLCEVVRRLPARE